MSQLTVLFCISIKSLLFDRSWFLSISLQNHTIKAYCHWEWEVLLLPLLLEFPAVLPHRRWSLLTPLCELAYLGCKKEHWICVSAVVIKSAPRRVWGVPELAQCESSKCREERRGILFFQEHPVFPPISALPLGPNGEWTTFRPTCPPSAPLAAIPMREQVQWIGRGLLFWPDK